MMGSMVVLVGSVPSLVSLVGLAATCSPAEPSSSSSSYSLLRRVSVSKRGLRGAKRWHCVSCKCSVTTTDLAAEQGNAVSLDSSNTFRGSSSGGGEIALKPAPKPVLKAKGETTLGGNSNSITRNGEDSTDDNDEQDERNKVIESLGEVLEKAEKLETSKPTELGSADNSISSRKENGSVNRTGPSNTATNSRTIKPVNSLNSRKTKTVKSVWRKGDTVANVPMIVREAPKTGDNVVKEVPKAEEEEKLESQPSVPSRTMQPPLRPQPPQPKLQAKPSVAPSPVIKKSVVLKDVGARSKSAVIDGTDSAAAKIRERQPILVDKFARKELVADPLIAQAVEAPIKPGKSTFPGKSKGRRKGDSSGGPRRRIVDYSEDDVEDEETSELDGAATARKGRKWTKAARRAARLQAAKEAAPVKVDILEVGDRGMSVEELAYNLAISEGEILGYLYSKGVRPDGVQTLDKDMVKMICKEREVEVIDADSVKVEEMARKKEILDEDDLDKLEERPPVLTIMGHVDHGKVGGNILYLSSF